MEWQKSIRSIGTKNAFISFFFVVVLCVPFLLIRRPQYRGCIVVLRVERDYEQKINFIGKECKIFLANKNNKKNLLFVEWANFCVCVFWGFYVSFVPDNNIAFKALSFHGNFIFTFFFHFHLIYKHGLCLCICMMLCSKSHNISNILKWVTIPPQRKKNKWEWWEKVVKDERSKEGS